MCLGGDHLGSAAHEHWHCDVGAHELRASAMREMMQEETGLCANCGQAFNGQLQRITELQAEVAALTVENHQLKDELEYVRAGYKQ